jgi:KDO2-lipid IV(A) lauroyltransferase
MPRKTFKELRDRFFYGIVVACIWFFRLLPRRLGIGIMRLVGRLLFFFGGSARRRTIEHLTMVFGREMSEADIVDLARRVFLHFSTILVDILRLPQLTSQGMDRLVTAQGAEHIERAMQGGRGVILLTGHFGNWEMLGAWASQHGYRLKVVGSPLFDERLDRLLVNIRSRSGYENIARGKGTREIIRSLRDGHSLGILIDQDTKVPGVFVRFFGRPAYTPVGAVQLAMKLGVDIVPIFMRLQDDFSYRVECGPPINLEQSGDLEADLFNNTQKCSDAYEHIIRRFPEQWAWMHKRWKTQPEQFGKDAVGSKKVFG